MNICIEFHLMDSFTGIIMNKYWRMVAVWNVSQAQDIMLRDIMYLKAPNGSRIVGYLRLYGDFLYAPPYSVNRREYKFESEGGGP